MSTKSNFKRDEITTGNRAFSMSRTTLETAFYGNNVRKVTDLKEAYEMAKNTTGTIVTDMPVYEPEKIGLPKGANILLFNDGETVGRFAGARVILGEKGVVEADVAKVLREAVYNTRYKKMLHTQAYIGLDEDFIIKANLLVPETYENTLYNWLLNFQYITKEYDKMYARSREIGDEPDIYIVSDPDFRHPKYPDGLAYFDPEHNCACLLGLRYFGEHKKGTLTLVKVCEDVKMEVIIIDSISQCWDNLLKYHANLQGNSFSNWQKITPRMNAFMQKILQSPSHVICTMRCKQDYVLSEKNGKMIPEKVGLKALPRASARSQRRAPRQQRDRKSVV